MSKLATQKRNKKHQSRFQKMWARLERLKADISRRNQDLDTLASRVGSEIMPQVHEAAKADIHILLRLLDLGQRKSWANWQRQEIESWIHQCLHAVATFNLLDDDLRNEIARYDAFRMGVELDENDGRSPGEQLDEIVELHKQQMTEAKANDEADMRALFVEQREALVEDALDAMLGPRPKNLATDNPTEDLWSEERDKQIEQAQLAYDEKRAALRESLTEEMQRSFEEQINGEFRDEDFDTEEYDDDFGFDDDFDERPFENNDATFKLDNATVQRMFRSAAAVLHPDKEADPDKRESKHKLMQQLLAARKNGDVMTLLSLYQEHVENGEALSKDDEKQLIGALERQVAELEDELEYYTPTTELHEIAFDLYSPHGKQVEKNIAKYLKELEQQKDNAIECAKSMRSMNALKPILEERSRLLMEMEREAYMSAFYDD